MIMYIYMIMIRSIRSSLWKYSSLNIMMEMNYWYDVVWCDYLL